MCEKRGECIRRCFGEHRLLYHAELQTVDLEDGICWQAKHIGEGVMDKCRWRQRSDKISVRTILKNVFHRWLNKALIPYLYQLITCCAWLRTLSSLAKAKFIEKMNMLYVEQYISILHSFQFVSTQQYNGAQCLWTRNSTHETEMKWEEKRMGNCLSCRSPSLYIGYLSAVIAPFNVPGECR